MSAAVTPIATETVQDAASGLLSDIVDGAEHEGSQIVASIISRSRNPGGVPQPTSQSHAWAALSGQGSIQEPTVNPEMLVRLPSLSSILPQCIRALVQGIHGHGYGFDPTFDASSEDADEEFLAAATAEKERAQSFFTSASLEMAYSELAERLRADISTVGWGGLELIRDMKTGELCGLEHVPAVMLRLGVPDEDLTLISRNIMVDDGSTWRKAPAWRYLRRYVQLVNGTPIYFKEPGDPRAISRETGEVVRAAQTTEDHSDPEIARELLWFSEYNPASPYGYGVPPWIGTMVDIAGERQASVVNWSYFDNKAVPDLAILIQGGALTKASHDRIKEKWDELKGVDNFHKVLILEAQMSNTGSIADLVDPAAATTPKVEIKELTNSQHGDALFQNYSKAARVKVRSSCGVPSILTGESEDYTRATAQVAMEVAEKFTFSPPRNRYDDRIQRFVMSDLQIKWWVFRSNPPNLADVDELTKAIDSGVAAGVGSPNIYAQVLEKVLGVEIPQVEQAYANMPIDLTKIAMQSGLVTLDFESGALAVTVNEELRERFKTTVGEVLEETMERLLMKARAMTAMGGE